MAGDPISLSAPDVGPREIELVTQVMRSGRLSIGPMQERFESMVSAKAQSRHGVAVSSGTAGLHLALLALGIGPGDEVVTTPFSFIASANVILYTGATPVFVDVDPKTLNADPEKVDAAITPRTKAILAVEALGNPAHMHEYAQIAAKHEIPLIEDCCEALGTSVNGRACGSFGRVGVFGFYPNKQITTGEGGMIVTNDEHLAETCRSLRNQGRGAGPSGALGTWLAHERLGYNYRLNEVSAAIGVGQMLRFDEIVARRQEIASLYTRALAGNPRLILPTVLPGAEMSWFVYVVRLAAGYTREDRDRVLQGMRNHDIGCADYFPCIHLQPVYRERFGFEPGAFPIAESGSTRTVALPFHGGLTPRDVDLVSQTLDLMLSRLELTRPEP